MDSFATPVIKGAMRQDKIRDLWRKLVESEARIEIWGKLVRLVVVSKELELFGDNIRERFRSKKMNGGSM